MLLDMQVVCFLIEFSMMQISVQNLTMKRLRGYEIKVMDNRDNFKLLCNYVLYVIMCSVHCHFTVLGMITYV